MFSLRNRLLTSGRAWLPTLSLSLALSLTLQAGGAHADEAAAASPEVPETTLEPIEVSGFPFKGYRSERISSATKTDTPLIDIPQAINVVTREQIRDQAIQSMAEAVRYVPGVGFAQGEGNRDTPIFRGNSSTGDFYVDGVRDDVQYFRDLYNVERIEVLKGPNAMIFGRGGSGGIINRVTKAPDWSETRRLDLTLGSWSDRRISGDVDHALSERAALRVAGVYEKSDSFRDGYELERWGINPTLSFRLGDATLLTLGYEHFEDERTGDRGVPSWLGRPLDMDPSTFFGNPTLSPIVAKIDAFNLLLDHEFDSGVTLRNHTRWADYAKTYQNVYPGAVNASGTEVALSAYRRKSDRSNLFNQTDLSFGFATGSVRHEWLLGFELGRQDTWNTRDTGYFLAAGPDVRSISVPIDAPIAPLPVEFRRAASDADNRSDVNLAALYVQDQIALTEQLHAIVGLRYDRFEAELLDHRDGSRLSTVDHPVSPRAGLVYKLKDDLSLYASYSVAFQPRAGEQLASLTANNAALAPEKFRNYEIGAKWDLRDELSASLALYRLNRSNVAVVDPLDPSLSILVDGQRSEGIEFSLAGRLSERWQLIGGYAWQDGRITHTQSANAQQGAALAQTPRHSFSLWNRYDFSPRWGVGLGLVARSSVYASTDNKVTLPGYARLDAAIYYTISEDLRLQANIENLLDRRYWANAHNNNNISPGSPRALRIGLDLRF